MDRGNRITNVWIAKLNYKFRNTWSVLVVEEQYYGDTCNVWILENGLKQASTC